MVLSGNSHNLHVHSVAKSIQKGVDCSAGMNLIPCFVPFDSSLRLFTATCKRELCNVAVGREIPGDLR